MFLLRLWLAFFYDYIHSPIANYHGEYYALPFNMTIIPIKLFLEGGHKYLLTEPKYCPSMQKLRDKKMYSDKGFGRLRIMSVTS